MVSITIEIQKRVYDAVDEARKRNTTTTPHPDNPEKAVIGPAFESVEAWMQVIINEWLAQFAPESATPEATALAEQIKADIKRLQEMSKPTISVRKG